MSDVRVIFRCGHVAALGSAAAMDAVRCAICGETRVRNVTAPPPRFTARDCDAQGPCVVKGS